MSIAEIRLPIRLPIRVSIGVEVIPHHHIMEEMYHVISGSGLMMVDDQYQQKVTGDSVVT
jgi:mannose-6-phosphate isomerase-like protein (cupin superfamily)